MPRRQGPDLPASNVDAVNAVVVALDGNGKLDVHAKAQVRLALTLALELDTGDEAPSAALVNQYRATLTDLAGKAGAGDGNADSWILQAVPS